MQAQGSRSLKGDGSGSVLISNGLVLVLFGTKSSLTSKADKARSASKKENDLSKVWEAVNLLAYTPGVLSDVGVSSQIQLQRGARL